MSKRRKREKETDLRRRRPHREEQRVYLVVCEGETEKRYFDTMKRHPDVRLHTVHVRKSKHPQSEIVVRSASQAARDEYTEVWAVFDTDGQDVTGLVRAAERDGVEAAPSTPTFESWLILHLVDHRAAIESGAKAEKILTRLLPGWDKGGTHFKDFAHGLKDACERAARLPEGADPSTGVHRLVHVILRD
ncbi:RloB-like protein [Nocardiopsis sp. Huas11]|uniref:RloB family protein n=1 Tax=Nocardiopsis sp. Huas11 TaxID=2183912 RepID=UPI000EB52B00|nr:RloB family protein [Nocardiopsis sp. Huas11]RKS06090.1 RloB-like protein [Nocardiopsis sp. Huas11]